MFGFIKKVFIAAMTFFSFSVLNVNSLECVLMNIEECKARTKLINVSNNEPVFYPYSIKVNKCGGSCNNISNPYAKLCVPDIVKNINVKVFNLMQRINETRHIIWHKTCKCICSSTKSVCISRKIWNEGECRCECKEDLIDNGICDKPFIWNPSNCQCHYDKSNGIGEYLDHKSCVCRNSVVDKLVEECSQVIDENKIYNETLNAISSGDCASCTLYVVLFAVFLRTSIIIGSSFIYFYWYSKKDNDQSNLKKDNVRIKFNPGTTHKLTY